MELCARILQIMCTPVEDICLVCANYVQIMSTIFFGFVLLIFCHTHTHTCLTTLSPALPGCAGARKVKPIWILLKQETVSGSGISWAVCKSAPRSRQITTPATHQSVFYGPDAFPAAQPTASKHCHSLEIKSTY